MRAIVSIVTDQNRRSANERATDDHVGRVARGSDQKSGSAKDGKSAIQGVVCRCPRRPAVGRKPRNAVRADKAWQEAESKVREGRGTALVRVSKNFRSAIPTTNGSEPPDGTAVREKYHYTGAARIITWLKAHVVIEVMPD